MRVTFIIAMLVSLVQSCAQVDAPVDGWCRCAITGSVDAQIGVEMLVSCKPGLIKCCTSLATKYSAHRACGQFYCPGSMRDYSYNCYGENYSPNMQVPVKRSLHMIEPNNMSNTSTGHYSEEKYSAIKNTLSSDDHSGKANMHEKRQVAPLYEALEAGIEAEELNEFLDAFSELSETSEPSEIELDNIGLQYETGSVDGSLAEFPQDPAGNFQSQVVRSRGPPRPLSDAYLRQYSQLTGNNYITENRIQVLVDQRITESVIPAITKKDAATLALTLATILVSALSLKVYSNGDNPTLCLAYNDVITVGGYNYAALINVYSTSMLGKCSLGDLTADQIAARLQPDFTKYLTGSNIYCERLAVMKNNYAYVVLKREESPVVLSIAQCNLKGT